MAVEMRKTNMNTETVIGAATFDRKTPSISANTMAAQSICRQVCVRSITGPVSFRQDGKSVFVHFPPL
jgi:hypothetical protein